MRFGSHHRSDTNQPDVVKELRKVMGASVAITSGAGSGFPDLVVGTEIPIRKLIEIYGMDGVVPMNFLMEVKHPDRVKLKPSQKKFNRKWYGQVAIITTPDQALVTIGVYKDAGNYQRTGSYQETEREGGV